MKLAKAIAVVQASKHRFLRDLAQFLQFPSVSSRPEHREDVGRCAEWLAEHLREIGIQDVAVTQTAGHPLCMPNGFVHGEHRRY
jgi:acetylornithine deacetylase/succinyl-diaminopimelate desuccinylase-like protein